MKNIKELVIEGLNNAVANGFDFYENRDPVEMIADDICRYNSELDNEDPETLIPHIKFWLRKRALEAAGVEILTKRGWCLFDGIRYTPCVQNKYASVLCDYFGLIVLQHNNNKETRIVKTKPGELIWGLVIGYYTED